jgi:capsular exopolysaccharide synthesis family protein
MNDLSMDMQRQTMDSWQIFKNRLGTIILSFLLVFAVAAIITYIMPRKYRGQVKMKIERDPTVVRTDPLADRSDPTAYTDVFSKTEFETLTMSETLYPVVEQLNLAKQWNLPDRRAALGKLRGNLEPQSSVKSDYVIIDYYDEEPQLAADVANAVAASYMAKRISVERERKEAALTVLKKQITDLEQQRTIARQKMTQAQRDAGIVGDSMSSGMMQARTPGASVVTSESNIDGMRAMELYKLNTDIIGWKSEIEMLQRLSPDELVQQAPALKIDNAVISTLFPELQKSLIAKEGALQNGLGRKHPTILGLDKQIETNKQLILAAAKAHMEGLAGKLASAEQRKNELSEFNKSERKDAIDKQASAVSYQTAKADVEQMEKQLLDKRDRLLNEEANLDITKSAAYIGQKAEMETTPTKPRVMLNLTLGAIMGLLFGVGLAFALEYMDTSVKTIDDVERFLGVPVLAVIPQNVGVLHRASGFSPDAEAYRILRTNIEFNRRNANANCITVVSGGAGEGKSTTLTNLAFVCAQGGYNVLLIDADLRRPRLHTLFDTSNAVGLTNYLTTDVQLEDVVLKTPVDNLYFLPSGVLPADSAGILNSQRMSDLIADVKSRFDLVLIDSPPILGVSDASVLANEADMTIIVVQHRKLPKQMLQRVKQAVDNVGGNVLGVVLNNVDISSDSSYAYYTSYYTYYAPANMPGGAPEKRKRKKAATPATAPQHVAANRRPGDDIF